jgi:general secretion pathway protein J
MLGRSRLGFTLVELLIALSIIGIVLLLLFSALSLATRSWESIHAYNEKSADLRIARNLIQRTLRQLRRQEDVSIEGLRLTALSGDNESIEWIAELSMHLGLPGLYMLRLVIEEDQERSQLVLYRWLLHPDILAGGDDWPAWEPLSEGARLRSFNASDDDVNDGAFGRTTLISDLDEFRIEYFGRLEGEARKVWSESWLDQPRLPRLVRIHVTTPGQEWAPMSVPLPGN